MKSRANLFLFFLFLFLSLNTFSILLIAQISFDQSTVESNHSSEISSAAIRTINFSGYEWYVKDSLVSGEKWGPGPNWWNGSSESVWVDFRGYLHLKIVKVGSQWHCAEVWSKESFGYGQYLFQVDPFVEMMDKNIILGLFTYYNDTQEIDIELAKWGDLNAENSQYVVQPYYNEGNMKRFNTEFQNRTTTHSFIWTNNSIQFSSGFGNISNYNQSTYTQWTYTGKDNPIPGTEKVHINLWLMNGLPPSNNQEFEVIIERFEFRNLTVADSFGDLPNTQPTISGPSLQLLFLTICTSAIIYIKNINKKRNNFKKRRQ
jgi:hypothetical protein